MGARSLLISLGLVLVAAWPAAADSWSAPDRAHDVTSTTYSPDPEPCGTVTTVRKKGNRTTDILGLAVDHQPESVVIRVTFRGRVTDKKIGAEIPLRTSGRDYVVLVDRYAPEDFPDVTLVHEVDPGDGDDECGFVTVAYQSLACNELATDDGGDPHAVRVVVPRTCLESPDWVRAGASSHRFKAMSSTHDRWGRKKDVPKDNPFVGPLGPKVRVGSP
jgi:hypothetical protein